MDRQDVLKRLLYPKCKTALEFKFDSLIVDPLLSYITIQDIAQLNKIATSLKYSSKPKEKYTMIDNIMTNRGFKKMASGTNRVTYRCLNDYRIVIKIAIDKVGLSDNGNEYRNQQLLKPFVTKCFEVSPCGTVGLFERVVPITSREEFVNISDDIFDLINNLIGKYVLEDIGEKFYMNYGLREGFGPVLLDYPYVFELDGRKLICNVPEPLQPKGYCGGEIDYDIGYNDLVCKKCGKRYLATELKSDKGSDRAKIIIEGEDMIMKCVLRRGDEIVAKLNSDEPIATNTIRPKKDFSRLKAHLINVEEKEQKEEFRREIKNRDDVQLTARLRGHRTSKDIDKEAIEKETRLERNSEKINVDLSTPTIVESVEEVSKFEVEFFNSENSIRELPAEEPVEIVETESEIKDSKTDEDADIIVVDEFINAAITSDGKIFNVETSELIGYTIKELDKKDKPSEPVEEDIARPVTIEEENERIEDIKNSKISSEVVYTDPESTGTTIGEIVGSKSFAPSNYKSNDIVSPIPSYFSKSEESNTATSEKKTEIPELIIQRRREEDDYEDNQDYDYDPEYNETEEEDSDSDPLAEYL